jgi:GNAT superfamily N-acetyltransferase
MPAVISAERPDTPDAIALIRELSAILEAGYPPESVHGFSVQKLIDQQVAFFVLRADGVPAGCGGILFVGSAFGELKRMYVRPEFRGRRYGELLIAHLAAQARARGLTRLRLETGIHQTAALRLYDRVDFEDPVSRCYEMALPGGAT